ncbi:MAG: STM3941 family protein [Bacteroidia bacterium]
MDKIEIQLSKQKLFLMLIGCLIFVGLGVWIISKAINPPAEGTFFFRNPMILWTAGISGILFFGMIFFFIVKKLGDNSPGLIISPEGILDNASGVSAGFIPWADINEIREPKVSNQKFLNIIVKNPQNYIDNQQNRFRKKVMQLNYNSYGTVISISAIALKYKYADLKSLLETELKKHKP